MTHEILQEMTLGPPEEFRPFRCSRCGRLLCLEMMVDGALKIKCRRCKTLNVLAVRPSEPAREGT